MKETNAETKTEPERTYTLRDVNLGEVMAIPVGFMFGYGAGHSLPLIIRAGELSSYLNATITVLVSSALALTVNNLIAVRLEAGIIRTANSMHPKEGDPYAEENRWKLVLLNAVSSLLVSGGIGILIKSYGG